jgi:hypothetical protein
MTRDENRRYVAKSESLAKPRDITAISFLGDFNRLLPRKAQQAMLRKGSGKVPYMGFILEPYCLFVAFRIRDESAARALLPDGYELAPAAMFRNGERHPLAIVSAFTARTSAFMGMRLEWYVIGQSRETGAPSWIIVDYVTNTNSHDPKNGFCGYSADSAIHATTPYGELLVDVRGAAGAGAFAARADLTGGAMEELDEPLWVDGNMTVSYGGALKDESAAPFSLIFDPVLMERAMRIPPDRIEIQANTFLKGLIDPTRPESVAVFPYSQHFVIRQDLKPGSIARKEDLYREIGSFLDREGVRAMSGDDLKRPLLKGMAISFLVNLGIIVFLLVKLLA